MPRARLTLILAAAAGLLPAGCFQAHNPTYFPNWGWEGPIDRTHAKPSGGAYFKNYDKKACKLEVTPLQCNNPVGTQQVLIASVLDADGMPRRSRRVEWIIEGPGNIVEVDESGWYSGRGYKVDNKYAVSYTDYKEHTITRGNDNPRDDFTIAPGQSWCVVTSAVEGQTTVTAYAPEVFNWDSGRVTSVLTWGPGPVGGFGPAGPGGIAFPPPVVSRAGGEAALTTTVSRGKNADAADGLKVRYRVIDGGASAVLLAGASAAAADGSTVLYGAGRGEADVATDDAGKAVVTVRQPAAKPGTTRIAIEVLKPDPNGGADTVVKKSETRVEWASADLTLNLKAPKIAPLNQDVPITLVMANVGKADSQPVTVRVAVPEGVGVVRADLPPTGQTTRTLAWAIGTVPGGGTKPITLTLRPTRKGTLDLTATADTPDGLRAEQRASVPVDMAGLTAAVTAPKQAGVGDKVTVTVSVTNVGAVPVDGTTAWLTLDDGLTAEGGTNQPELALGRVPAGETKRAEVRVSARKAGRYVVRANVTADGGLTARADGSVEVRRSELTATISGPATVNIGQDAAWDVRVTNAGEVPLTDVTVRAALPRGLTAATDQTSFPIGTLAAGEKRTVRVAATGDSLSDDGVLKVTATAGGTGGLTARSEAAVSVVGRPALTVELPDPPGVIPVGRRGPVRVVVRNTGDAAARRVEVTVAGSAEVTLYGGAGPDRAQTRPDGGKLAFPPLDSLAPGATATFTVDVGATTPGAARLTAEVRADHLSQPVRDEQSARVVP